MFGAINHFVDQLGLEGMEAAAKLFSSELRTNIFTPREVDEYNK